MKTAGVVALLGLAAIGGFALRAVTSRGAETAHGGAHTTADPAGTSAATAEHSAGAGTVASPSELEAARAKIADLEERNIRMRGELAAAQEGRVAREREFLRYTQGIAQLSTLATATRPQFTPEVPEDRPPILDVPKTDLDEVTIAAATKESALATQAAEPVTSASLATAQTLPPPPDAARNRAIFHTLRALLAAEQVTSLDLLESGNLGDRCVGPIVLRVLDERGRPLGSIAAERLHLEASRAARMITLVLEHGYERHGGEKVPFEGGPPDADMRGGVRRIALPDCDPRPWLDGLPELFDPNELVREIDDARHDLGALRATLNQLLHADAANGWYRVQGIGGVQGSVLRDVALDRLDRDGKLERRLFADRMSILREETGLQLSLEGGSQVRGDQKIPFLDGRCRIFLPRAAVDTWIAARVPGLAPDDPPPLKPAEKADPKKP